MQKQVNGELVDLTPDEIKQFRADLIKARDEGYRNERRSAYPCWNDQLEALYDDIQSGIFGPRAMQGKFASAIDAVKLAIPKKRELVAEDPEALDEITKEVFGLKEEVRDE